MPNEKPEVNERKALETVQKHMANSREFRRRYEETWTKMLGEYLNTRSVKSNALQRANLKIAYAFNVIEGFVPQLVEVFLKEKPYITAVGRKPPDVEWAETISSYFTYQLDQMKFSREWIGFIKNTLIYGTGIAKTVWKRKEEYVTQTKKQVDKFNVPYETKIEAKEITFDGPTFENIDILDFFPDPSCIKPGDIQSMRGCVHRVYRTYDELKNQGIYKNLDKLKDGIDKNGCDAWSNMSRSTDDWSKSQRSYLLGQEPGIKTKDQIELWEYWGLYNESDKEGSPNFKPKVITIANGNVVIRADDNPFDYKFKPFISCIDYLIPGEFYGMGEIQVVYSMIKEGTALRNARLDQANQAVNRMWIVDRNSGINVRNLYARNGGIILTNDMQGIRDLPVPEVPASSYKEISQIDYDIQNTTGLINASQGASNIGRAFGSTATGVNYMEGYTANRMSMKCREIESWCMQEFGQILLLLNKQFTKKEEWIRLYDGEKNPFVLLDPESFFHDYDFYTTGAMERLNKQQRQTMFQQNILPFLQTVEKYQPFTLKMDAVVKRFFKEFDYQNVNELVNTPEERQQLQQQNSQQQMMQQQAQIQSQTQQQMALQQSEQQAKAERDAANAQNKAHLAVVKGLMDVGNTIAAKDYIGE